MRRGEYRYALSLCFVSSHLYPEPKLCIRLGVSPSQSFRLALRRCDRELTECDGRWDVRSRHAGVGQPRCRWVSWQTVTGDISRVGHALELLQGGVEVVVKLCRREILYVVCADRTDDQRWRRSEDL